ncbi:MAG: response regulator [Acidobacteria bacterium]|nr:response regulator [Acidobacteriota bacterium]
MFQILLAEDNPGDVRLTKEAFKRMQAPVHVNVASNGEEALAYLRRAVPYSDVARPDLILLDLNMPRKDGRAVLAEIKKDPDLDSIPVIVLTSSQAEEDVVSSYKLHANCFISKPIEMQDYDEVIRSIEQFWIQTATLP